MQCIVPNIGPRKSAGEGEKELKKSVIFGCDGWVTWVRDSPIGEYRFYRSEDLNSRTVKACVDSKDDILSSTPKSEISGCISVNGSDRGNIPGQDNWSAQFEVCGWKICGLQNVASELTISSIAIALDRRHIHGKLR